MGCKTLHHKCRIPRQQILYHDWLPTTMRLAVVVSQAAYFFSCRFRRSCRPEDCILSYSKNDIERISAGHVTVSLAPITIPGRQGQTVIWETWRSQHAENTERRFELAEFTTDECYRYLRASVQPDRRRTFVDMPGVEYNCRPNDVIVVVVVIWAEFNRHRLAVEHQVRIDGEKGHCRFQANAVVVAVDSETTGSDAPWWRHINWLSLLQWDDFRRQLRFVNRGAWCRPEVADQTTTHNNANSDHDAEDWNLHGVDAIASWPQLSMSRA